MLELLAPVGNFDSLKAAVQNGADAVYFGSSSFNARAFAGNFSTENLQEAILYAKLRGVQTHLTLNTLIKDNELEEAFNLVKQAYEFGIDAVIVQDLGLADLLIKSFPDLPVHSSTQMSIHNLEGVLKLQEIGFSRVVLSRELSLRDIEYICKHSSIEIETFIHGALCISYSGQCLFSSLVGGRSGNRGKCAQSCRLPYELLEDNKKLDSGYLLSTRDLCSLQFLPDLILAGVKSFKIEGRMKSSEYVAVVTKIYRKYLDLAMECVDSGHLQDYHVEPEDEKMLLQVFNRGNFSNGHLDDKPNKELVFKEKPNNMGIYLGIVQNYNSTKGHITLKLKDSINIGDTIALQRETGTYTISEILKNNQNIKDPKVDDIVTIGRMKGNIQSGDKIYKISSKVLSMSARESFSKENKKVYLDAKISIKKGKPISIKVTPSFQLPKAYNKMNIKCELADAIPMVAKNQPLIAENVFLQLTKTHNTPYQFKHIQIDLDDNLFLQKNVLNELRRTALQKVEEFAVNNITRKSKSLQIPYTNRTKGMKKVSNPKISVLLNTLNTEYVYQNLDKSIDSVYIPLKYFTTNSYENIIKTLTDNFNVYIYIPTIVKVNYRNLLVSKIHQTLEKFPIKGFVIANLGNLEILESANLDLEKYDLVGNYTLNIFNTKTISKLRALGLSKITNSPELDKATLLNLCSCSVLPQELIVYGKLPLMNIRYCLLGNTNQCYPECKSRCTSNHTYYLKDRLQMKFRVLPDNIQTVTTIFNSKILSILYDDFSVDSVRVDILDETIDEINNVVNTVKNHKRFEGSSYTNGNLNRKDI